MRLSVQTKLILGIVGISLLVFCGVTLIFLFHQKNFLTQNFQKQALVLAQALNASIESEEIFEHPEVLQNNIYKLMWLNPDIIDINISARYDNQLKIVASNKSTLVGKNLGQNSFTVIEKRNPFTKIQYKDGERVLVVAGPIHSGGRIIGTHEITLSLKPLDESIRSLFWHLLLFISLAILVMIVGLSLLMRFVILKPIFTLKKAVQAFGAGNLQFKIKKFPNDEFGQLAQGFNKMSESLLQKYKQLEELNKKLQNAYELAQKEVEEKTRQLEQERASLELKVKERTKELEELKRNLEKKVEERTKELKEKIEELEKIQKITMGRELKMMELKREIERLKEELRKK
jgi:methyl-accepting chemotaxis protein